MKTIYSEEYSALINLLRQRRITLGLRQADVARQMQWGRNTLSTVERGQRRLDLLETLALARVLGVSLRRIEKLLR